MRKLPREIRKCQYQYCSNTFEVSVTSLKRYCCKSHSMKVAARNRKPVRNRQPWSDESRREMSAKCKGKIFSEEHKKNLSLAHKGKKRGPNSLESNLKRSQSVQKYWDNIDEYTASQRISRSLGKSCKHPNNFETNSMAYVNAIYSNKVRYTGNGTLIINKRSVDAELTGTKTVFLFNGIYWHLLKYGYEITEENKRLIEAKESYPFTSVGYTVVFIWEDELNELINNNRNKSITKIYG
jgi:hypothetical protein